MYQCVHTLSPANFLFKHATCILVHYTRHTRNEHFGLSIYTATLKIILLQNIMFEHCII